MGDTGSLAMGAALSGVALLSNSLWPLLVMGGLFVAESLSVIIQVWVFKATKGPDGQGRRVFRMAPLHHHFELGGTDERSVVPAFWLVTAGLVLSRAGGSSLSVELAHHQVLGRILLGRACRKHPLSQLITSSCCYSYCRTIDVI